MPNCHQIIDWWIPRCLPMCSTSLALHTHCLAGTVGRDWSLPLRFQMETIEITIYAVGCV